MGVLVWLLGNARAVPVNYPHVEVNYTRLNWYNGSAFAYADYQDLVTEAMNEVGGMGFATDYAGTDVGILAGLPDPNTLRGEITRLGNLAGNQEFYTGLTSNFVFQQAKVLEILKRQLPLPEGTDESVYTVFDLLDDVVDEQALSSARSPILFELIESVIEPLEETLDVFDGMPYLTRMYTTLSPEEMMLDPCFVFNPDLPDQPLAREATLRSSCVGSTTVYDLILGAGTGRDGEQVLRVNQPEGVFFNPPDVAQSAVLRSVRVGTSGPGDVDVENDFDLLVIGTAPSGSGEAGEQGSRGAFCAFGLAGWLPLTAGTMFCLRRPRRPRNY
jgi:hypothetical protein